MDAEAAITIAGIAFAEKTRNATSPSHVEPPKTSNKLIHFRRTRVEIGEPFRKAEPSSAVRVQSSKIGDQVLNDDEHSGKV